MTDLSELAKQTVATITPFLAAGGTELVKGASADLWKSLKGIFKKKGKEELLDQLVDTPEDEVTISMIENELRLELQASEDLMKELLELVKGARHSEEYINYSNQKGDNNISIQGQFGKSSIDIKR